MDSTTTSTWWPVRPRFVYKDNELYYNTENGLIELNDITGIKIDAVNKTVQIDALIDLPRQTAQ